jgi:transcriptional activator SPT8
MSPGMSVYVLSILIFSQRPPSASQDNIRLWNVSGDGHQESDMKNRGIAGLQFKIIPGHHGGTVSQLGQSRSIFSFVPFIQLLDMIICGRLTVVDPGGRFMISASSSRGWVGESTRTVFVHDLKWS